MIMKYRVYCPDCGWEGTAEQSLEQDPTNDTCPYCGNTQLEYVLEDNDDRI